MIETVFEREDLGLRKPNDLNQRLGKRFGGGGPKKKEKTLCGPM
jgi:hypothetical protein